MYEAQLAKAKIEKAEIGADFNKERLKLQKDLLEANKNIEILISREENMKEQVELYAAQYDELVNGVDDKKKHFGQFKKQMDTLNKRLKTLEMDSSMWKEKFEGQYQSNHIEVISFWPTTTTTTGIPNYEIFIEFSPLKLRQFTYFFY